MHRIQIATTDEEMLNCFDAMHELRQHLNRTEFVALINTMSKTGYLLAFVKDNDKVAAVTGYRYMQNLFDGKLIYVDDLSTAQAYRKKGYAKLLLDFIFNEVKNNNCDQVHLDSGCGPHRYNAHRLYLNYGFNITSHHFAKLINKE